MPDDRRIGKRFTIRQFVDVSPEGDVFMHATGLNLSSGGLSCSLKMPLQPMTPLFIMIGLIQPDGEERVLKLEGFVTHSRMENGICVAGVNFVDVSPTARELLDAYLDDLSSCTS